ncbi:hypothetical protein BDR06DRAFT_186223 [Suillus hirtellus]|nr:hypothetical protein BDR06DRAFT_186223 [Suillus hirtellus]
MLLCLCATLLDRKSLVRHIPIQHVMIQHRKLNTYTPISICSHEILLPISSWIWIFLEEFWIRLWYSFMEVTSTKETSFAMIPALIANDTPRQVEWVKRCIRDCVPACGKQGNLGKQQSLSD